MSSNVRKVKNTNTGGDKAICFRIDCCISVACMAPQSSVVDRHHSRPTKDSHDDRPEQQEQDTEVEEKPSMSEDNFKTAEGEPKEEEELQPGGEHEENMHREEVEHAEEVPSDQVLQTHEEDSEREQKELDGLQTPQAPAPPEGGEGQQHGAFVHQGQPEM